MKVERHSGILPTIPSLVATCHGERSAAITARLLVVAAAFLLTFAAPATAQYSGGSGTAQDPYQIATAADLILLGETPADYGKHFILTADIDLDPKLPGRKVFDKAVIASDANDANFWFDGRAFTGVFDGNGHTISHLTITGKDYLGLFGYVSGAVKRLGVVDVNTTGSGRYVGGLVGLNYGTVTHCYSTGAVTGEDRVGGLVGDNSGGVNQCYSTGAISGEGCVGGLVGYNDRISSTLTQCYSTGAVSGKDYGGSSVWYNVVGGLVGYNGGRVTQCYSAGRVSGVGDNASVGGLVGSSYYYSDLYGVWDMETSGQSGSAGGVGLTTSEMMDPYMLGLNGFANDPNWVLDAGRDYPRLAWEGRPGRVIPEPRIDWLQGSGTAEGPYRVDTPDQLILLGKASILWGRHFVLGTDIDLNPTLPGRRIFGQAVVQTFTGVFDGKGHRISHLTIQGGGYLGLFGCLTFPGEVRNLEVVDVRITGSGWCVGALAGQMAGSRLAGCSSSGVVRCTQSTFVGGLVGLNASLGTPGTAISWGGTIMECHSICETRGCSYVGGLVGTNGGVLTHCSARGAVTGNDGVGGLAGQNYLNGGDIGEVTECYSTGVVNGIHQVGGLIGENYAAVTQSYSTAAVDGDEQVGGLIGENYGGGRVGENYYRSVTQCYSRGLVSGRKQVGGLVGVNHGSLIQCYSTGGVSGTDGIGGLAGANSDALGVAACFWDTQTSGQATSVAGTGKTTADMRAAATFLGVGWDFAGETKNGTDNLWWIDEGRDYPRLWWEYGRAFCLAPLEDATNVSRPAILQWISGGAEFSHDVYFGDDEGHVAGATVQTQGIYRGRQAREVTTYDPGILAWGKIYYWRIEEVNPNNPAAALKGTVWSFTTTDCVKSSQPADGVIDIIYSPILNWVAAEQGMQYDVYLGQNENDVRGATPQTLGIYRGRQASTGTTYKPGALKFNTTYYWRIDGVDKANPQSPWKGDVWSFTTGDYLVVVDDFESYTDTEGNRIYQTWKDGLYEDANHPGNGTGSVVGYTSPPFAEQKIVRSGQQSMPMDYNNVKKPCYSEADRTWATPQNWTIDGADTLTLYFRGEVDNGRERLYVGIEDSAGRIAVVAHPNAEAARATEWQKWHIALADVRAAGVDAAAVQKMVIGVGDRKNPQPGGTGRIYLDDIRLTKQLP